VGKPEEKRPLGRPKPRRNGNKKMDFRKLDGDIVWIDLARDRDRWRSLVNAVMKIRFPQNAGNFLTS
jgi:hypothetical protein